MKRNGKQGQERRRAAPTQGSLTDWKQVLGNPSAPVVANRPIMKREAKAQESIKEGEHQASRTEHQGESIEQKESMR